MQRDKFLEANASFKMQYTVGATLKEEGQVEAEH